MNLVQKFQLNTNGRDFIVGDIHGRFDLLDALMAQVRFDRETDRMFSVGDLVDRGLLSHQAIDYLRYPWFHALRGNHEQMAIDFATTQSGANFLTSNGGAWFVMRSLEEQLRIAEAFEELPFAFEIECDIGAPCELVGVVHACCCYESWAEFKERLVSQHVRDGAIWGRSKAVHVAGVDKVFIGHTIVKSLHVSENVINLDTGAYRTGMLTCAELSNPLTIHWTSPESPK